MQAQQLRANVMQISDQVTFGEVTGIAGEPRWRAPHISSSKENLMPNPGENTNKFWLREIKIWCRFQVPLRKIKESKYQGRNDQEKIQSSDLQANSLIKASQELTLNESKSYKSTRVQHDQRSRRYWLWLSENTLGCPIYRWYYYRMSVTGTDWFMKWIDMDPCHIERKICETLESSSKGWLLKIEVVEIGFVAYTRTYPQLRRGLRKTMYFHLRYGLPFEWE